MTTPRLVLAGRALAFNIAFWSWTFVLVFAAVPFALAGRDAMRSFVRFWLGGGQVLLRNLVGLDYEIRGRENLPAEPVIIASAHQSTWETFVFHLLVRDLAIALKAELVSIPMFGWYTMRAGMIRIDRGSGGKALRSLLREGKAALERGDSILIFPEGTRIAPGQRGDYQPGIAALYTHLGRKVVPVALNSGLFWGRRSFIKKPGTILVEFLPPIEPGLDRRAFMTELRTRLSGGLDDLENEGRRQLGDN